MKTATATAKSKSVAKNPRVATARQYECLFIVVNSITDEARMALVEKFTKMTGDANLRLEKWGLKKFATPIDHKKDGYYFNMNFTSTPDVPKKIGDLMNITAEIVRFMFVCKEDQQARKDKGQKKSKKTKEGAANE